MIVYIAIQKGVYRHQVIAVRSDLESAKQAASDAVDEEHDHYHDVEVLECELDGAGEKLLGYFRRRQTVSGDYRYAGCEWHAEEK